MSMKNSTDIIGNRTRYLPAYSTLPQPTALPRTPLHVKYPLFLSDINEYCGHAVAQLVEAMCYKPEGRGFDSR
jgi:hypothetical protein